MGGGLAAETDIADESHDPAAAVAFYRGRGSPDLNE